MCWEVVNIHHAHWASLHPKPLLWGVVMESTHFPREKRKVPGTPATEAPQSGALPGLYLGAGDGGQGRHEGSGSEPEVPEVVCRSLRWCKRRPLALHSSILKGAKAWGGEVWGE